MTQDGGYDITPEDKPAPPPGPPKPGEPGWVPPVPIIEKADADAAEAPVDPDIETNKGMALLGYICFLIPLVAAPSSKFARYHANQGLLLFILLMVNVILIVLLQGGLWMVDYFFRNITILDYFFAGGLHLIQFALLVTWVALMIYGIIQAANGVTKPLPGIGHWTLIK